MIEKTCSKCKVSRDIELFCKENRTISKIASLCKKCMLTYQKSDKFKERRRNYMNKYNMNPERKISNSMKTLIWLAIKKDKAGIRWEKLVGYNRLDLMNHLSSQFDEKMNWGNYGIYWEIDHIIPRARFIINSKHDLEFKKCWALNNLRPLSKNENRMLGCRVRKIIN